MNYNEYQISKGDSEEEFEGFSAEYAKHLIDYYNKEQFNAFTAIVNYRDESIRRISEIEEEIDDLINEVESEFQHLLEQKRDDVFEIMYELKPYLENLKNKPNNRLVRILEEILEEDLYYDCKRNRIIINNVKGLLQKLNEKSYVLKRVRIITSTAKLFINEVIDSGAPFKFNGSTAHTFIRSLFPNKEVNKPTKDTIYEWYEELKRENEDKADAFHQLQTEISAQGLDIEEYINTDDPENFDRAYRAWYKKKNSKRK